GVVRGPGSFTGLRVGLAAAQGLAAAAGVEARGVETTRAIALASGRRGRFAVVLEGGQGRVFAAVHEVEGDRVTCVREPTDVTVAEAVEWARPDGGVLRGSPADVASAALVAAGCVPFDLPLAAAAARLALVSDDPLVPLYARE